ncbi:15239_t:CDS:2, partial [Racocetra persica]
MNNPVDNHIGGGGSPDQEQEAENQIIEEFKNLKNDEAHDHIQQRIFALKRGVNVAKSATDFLGSDVRESLVPLMQNVLRGTIKSMNDGCKECNILDVMPGRGTQVDWFLSPELEGNLGKRNNNLYCIETNQEFIKSYKHTVETCSHLKLVKSYEKKVKDLYQKPLDTKVDFIMCMDLCFLTDDSGQNINPQNDIIDFVKFLYGQLKPGGAIFITYLDLESPFSKINFDYFDSIKATARKDNFSKIAKARDDLLYNGKIINELKEDEKSCPKVESHKLSTFYYAKTLAEVAIMSLDGGFLKYNKSKFELDHLKNLIKTVQDEASKKMSKNEKGRFGLCKAERGRDPLWRVESLQYACII